MNELDLALALTQNFMRFINLELERGGFDMRNTHNHNDSFGNNNNHFNGDKYSENYLQKTRAQPRKSGFNSHRYEMEHDSYFDYDDGDSHPVQRREPAKNVMRVQLRRIQQLF